MKKYMATPEFESVWPAMIAAPSYIGKAFSQMNGQSALTLSGVEPRSDVKIFNVHPNWDKLTQKQAQHVLNCVEAHSKIIDERGFISERVFDQTYQEGDAAALNAEALAQSSNNVQIDTTLPKTKGKPKNDMATNRQRAMIYNNKSWLEHLAEQKSAETARRAVIDERNRLIDQASAAGNPVLTKIKCRYVTCMISKPLRSVGWS